ncbi:MAG TPA: ATP-dependent metallopeptidase FtsH/Yme1/Tma family protein [Candidatus Melainabacteria bacterium]|nr:ATP-dependent metallopeptidase FtsH/Yme1/Tma family protein [Candidatus Melainabacteria bacterium]HIN63116.1 ATP-dependent metallopeptidase FtsH/Yme1/Tma family protein [Candidatus Obscuribacterales bacterium]
MTTSKDKSEEKAGRVEIFAWLFIAAFWLALLFLPLINATRIEVVPYSTFLRYAADGRFDEVTVYDTYLDARNQKDKFKIFKAYRIEDPDLVMRLSRANIKFSGAKREGFGDLPSLLLPAIIFFVLWMMLVNRAAGQGGMQPGLMSIEKSKAKVYMEDKVKVTFQDVAGVDEAKEELKEVVGFLKKPESFTRLGGHLPKGILLVGPPGTGKTLLARAVAGEACVPFFSISGSEFVEMFVGVGAARVRDLFAEAQRNAPCIVFIDELDALGRARGLNPMMGGHDEKEQTLNQLLVEMDGFDPRQGVVLLAATNRPEILDQALLRAGRFDRHVLVDRPDKIGRIQILTVHFKGKKIDPSVNPEHIASMTPGFTGADLANLVNEAVILATRRSAEAVNEEDFIQAVERIVAGLEKKSRILSVKERNIVAHHEMGHALVAMALPGTDPVQKISIIPRGIGALGYTMQRPTEDRYLVSKEDLENKLAVLLGGRAAEMLMFHELSTGAADDLSKATDIARSMVTRYGMIQSLGPVLYEADAPTFLDASQQFRSRPNLSEETLKEIDHAIKELIETAEKKASAILERYKTNLVTGAELLLIAETLTREDLDEIFPKVKESPLKLIS